MTNIVSFDRPKLRRLKTRIAQAQMLGMESFPFEGVEYVTQYAVYLAQYLTTQIKE